MSEVTLNSSPGHRGRRVRCRSGREGHVWWRVLNEYRRVRMIVLGMPFMHYTLRFRVDLAIKDVGFDFAVAAKVAEARIYIHIYIYEHTK